MAKGALLGLVFGVLLGAAGVRFIDSRQGARLEDLGVKAGEQDPRLKAGRDEAERLENALAAARLESSALSKKVGELEAKAKPAVENVAAQAKGNRWKDVGAAFYKMRDTMNDPNAGNSPDAQQAFMDMISILGKIAKDNGVSLDEVMGCPEAFPMLILSLIEAAGVQPDASQQAAIDSLMAEGKGGWTDYLAKREGMGSFERKLGVLGLQSNLSEGLRGALSGPTGQVVDDMKLWDADFSFGGTRMSFGGDRDGVSQNLTSAWVKDLGLDEAQKTAIGPAVEDYVREIEASKADIARREAAGQTVSSREKQSVDLNAMIKTQARLGETLRLTDAQAKALKNWGTVYGINLDGGGK